MTVIGIYSIFIDKYIYFFKDFLETVDTKFMPSFKKIYFIITDKKNEETINEYKNLYNINYKVVDYIGWPYETLYRFVYFNLFEKNKIQTCNYIYFLNSNIHINKICNNEILPHNNNYIFVKHQNNKKNKIPVETRNKNSSCFFNSIRNVTYVCGGFFGASTDNFIKLTKYLKNNIFKDEKKKYIAIWHDESHLNYYVNKVIKKKCVFLSEKYHGYGDKPMHVNKNIVYFKNKELFFNLNNVKKQMKYGKIKINNYNKHLFVKK